MGFTEEELKQASPTIEVLTEGEVTLGTVIDKTNVDLVNDHLSAGVYELVQRGMKLIMGEHYTPWYLCPKRFWDYTEKHKGQAVLDEEGTAYLKDGTPWPGGLPVHDPKTGQDIKANLKHGWACDEFDFSNQWLSYINKDGEVYKRNKYRASYVRSTSRMFTPPLGAYPGLENENYRRIATFLSPRNLKGIGQFTVRYYDDSKNADVGESYTYSPAFKRIIRGVSATSYQDNIVGSDFLFCDAGMANDPFVYWDYEVLDKRHMLTTSSKVPLPETDPAPLTNEHGDLDSEKIKFDGGMKYPRVWWGAMPVHVVEATPTIKHVYSKRVIYVPAPPFWFPSLPVQLGDIFDHQGRLYKTYILYKGGYMKQNNENFAQWYGFEVHDLQTGHSSRLLAEGIEYNGGSDPKSYSIQSLLERAK
jgi:hypothetical protein